MHAAHNVAVASARVDAAIARTTARASARAPAARRARSRSPPRRGSRTPRRSQAPPATSASEPRRFHRTEMYDVAIQLTADSPDQKRWSAERARWAASPRLPALKKLDREQLLDRARDCGRLAADAARVRNLLNVRARKSRVESQTEAAELRRQELWFADLARGARSAKEAALKRHAGLESAWVRAVTHDVMRGLTHGSVLQFSRFAVSQQLRRSSGLYKGCRKMLAGYAYGRLRAALRHDCTKRGVLFLEGSEAWITRTCLACGHVHTKEQVKLGDKVFVCCAPDCGASGHRDGLAAVKNAVKHLKAGEFMDAFVAATVAPRRDARVGSARA